MRRLNQLAREIKREMEANGFRWTKSPCEIATLLCLVHSEVSEALECLRDEKPLDEELADVIIRVLHLAAILEIDIEKAIEAKMKINRKRPFRHGRKNF
ncbi:MAG: hypothetical protein DRN81_03510 [Thermoproteota archaeon]|nr:MAG: hypothetical protein DRN81_03510 [Candidatus Korarchaeota archaeon]